MFKDFSALNQLAPDLVESTIAQEVRNALSVESDLVGMINDSVSNYVDVYNRIRFTRINPDTRTPEDVTTTPSNSAANSVLARLRARLTERKQLLSVYKNNISDSFSASEITRTVEIGVPPLTLGSQPGTSHSGYMLCGHWMTVGEDSSDSEIEAQLPRILMRQVVSATESPLALMDAAVRVAFSVFASKFFEYPYNGINRHGAFAEFVDGDLHILHGMVSHAVQSQLWTAYVEQFSLFWRTSGTGVAYIATNSASSPRRVTLSNITSNGDAVMQTVDGAILSGYTERATERGVTKELVIPISTVESVTKEETFTVSGADVVNSMFVSQSAIDSAISALADTE